MPRLVSSVQAGLMNKLASFTEIREVLIPKIPRDMAIRVTGELKGHELNFGEPADLEPVVVDIGRISGNLARSFNFKQLGPFTWAVQQTLAIAPYAGDVADYAQVRFGMTYLDSVRRRTHDFLMQGAKDEWERAWKLIDEGNRYRYRPLYAE